MLFGLMPLIKSASPLYCRSTDVERANKGPRTVVVLIVNAIAILSEDRFLARSTPPTRPFTQTVH